MEVLVRTGYVCAGEWHLQSANREGHRPAQPGVNGGEAEKLPN